MRVQEGNRPLGIQVSRETHKDTKNELKQDTQGKRQNFTENE